MSRALRLARGRITPAISLSADDATITVVDGGSSVVINLTIGRTNYTGNITLVVLGLPSGVTGTFSDSTITGAETSSVLTVSASGASAVTNSAFTITASGFGVTDATVAGTCTVTVGYTAHQSDDFSTYADSAALRTAVVTAPKYWSDAVNTSLLTLDTTNTFNGHNTMRYEINASGYPQVRGKFTAIGKCWLRIIIRFEPGFTTDGTGTPGSSAYKMFFVQNNGVNQRSGVEYTNGPSLISYLGGEKSTSPTGGGFTSPLNASVTSEWSDGEWYEYILYSEKQTGTPTNARFRWWRKKVSDPSYTLMQSTSFISAATAYPDMDRCLLGENYNRNRATSYYINWASWEIVDGDVYSDPWGVGA